MGFSLLSAWQARNKKTPALRVVLIFLVRICWRTAGSSAARAEGCAFLRDPVPVEFFQETRRRKAGGRGECAQGEGR